MKRRSTFRRWLLRVVGCLFIGLVINVIVAWGIALLPAIQKGATQPQDGFPEASWPAGAPADQLVPCVQEARQDRFGFTIIVLVEDDSMIFNPAPKSAISRRFGFPARSFEYSWFTGFVVTNGPYYWGMRDISAVRDKLGLGKVLGSQLPIQIRPAGFAINTFVYSVGALVTLQGLTAFRRRRRRLRSRCLWCGYDVGGVDRCPECGEGV